MDQNNTKYTDLIYYNNIISDYKERDILMEQLKTKIGHILNDINLEFDELITAAYVCINSDQKFNSLDKIERYDIVIVKINNRNEINKEVFADIVLKIMPEIQANMYYTDKSKISVTYQFEKQDEFHYIEFSLEDSDIELSKTYIVENTDIKTYP